MRKTPLALLMPLLLAACAVGPDFVRPDSSVAGSVLPDSALPPRYAQAGDATATPDDAVFWRSFDDPVLARLVDDALSRSFTIEAALARYQRANALWRRARADQLPSVRAEAGASDARLAEVDAPGSTRSDRDSERYDIAAVASWELDLLGRVRRSVEAGRAEIAASAAEVGAIRLLIAGDVARTYVALRGTQERLRVARDNAANQQETLRLVSVRLEAGIGTEFDTARARGQLEVTRARVPALEAELAVHIHHLAVLSARESTELAALFDEAARLPPLPARIAAGTPGELLRRRPDISAAEHRLHAATARVGVATADLFPRFTLSGLIGSAAVGGSDLFTRDSENRRVAVGIDWSFLDQRRVRAGIAAADADAAGALAEYRQTVLQAIEEVENALARYARARDEDAHLQQAAAASRQASQLARTRFEAGAIDLIEVLDAERALLTAEEQLSDARTRAASAAVALYVAIGGGWTSGEGSATEQS